MGLEHRERTCYRTCYSMVADWLRHKIRDISVPKFHWMIKMHILNSNEREQKRMSQ